MKVFILGATGSIGLPVAQAFVRAGHIVYGQTRSAAKAKQLAAEEIIPIVCEPTDLPKYVSFIPSLDAFINAVGGSDLKSLNSRIFAGVVEVAQTLRPPDAPKLAFIYTSGTWVHGENRTDVVSDNTPITAPATLVAWRPADERSVVGSTHVHGIVIRPSLLYGRGGSLLAEVFRGAHAGKVSWPGTPGGRLALVHADDLASVYVLAAEKAPVAAGNVFDATNEFTESTDVYLGRLVEVSGAKAPYEYRQPQNVFEEALGTTTLIRPYLARSLLGWQPRKAGLLDHLAIYYDAWKASEGL